MYEHFDDIENDFKEIHEQNKDEDTVNPAFLKIFKTNLFLYLGYMLLPFILSIFIVVTLMDNDFFFREVTPSEHAIEIAANDVNSLLIVDDTHFDAVDGTYKTFFIPVGFDGLSTIYVHSSATFIADTTFFSIVQTDSGFTYTLKSEIFNGMLDGSVTKWPNNAEITYYVPFDDVSPSVAGSEIDHVDTLIKASTVPTIAMNALFSFFVMLVIAVPMILISRPVLKSDINLLKSEQETLGGLAGKVGIGVIYMFGGSILINIVVMFLSSLLSVPQQISANQLSINLMLRSPYFILMAFSAVILRPIVEELVFRKSFFGLIKNQNYALIISSLVFGLIHISTEILSGNVGLALISSLPYIGAGFIFGYIYMIHKQNIVIPILVHMAYNLVSVLMSMFLLTVL